VQIETQKTTAIEPVSALELARKGDLPEALTALSEGIDGILAEAAQQTSIASQADALNRQRNKSQDEINALLMLPMSSELASLREREQKLSEHKSALKETEDAIAEIYSKRSTNRLLSDFLTEARGVFDYLPSDQPQVRVILHEIGESPLWGMYSSSAPPMHRFEGSLYGHLERQPLDAIQTGHELRKLQFRLGELLIWEDRR
jgi:hypothetical protein